MKLRVYTMNNYLDLDIKPNVDKEVIVQQIDAGNTIYVELETGNFIILNTINIVGIEIMDMPPITE